MMTNDDLAERKMAIRTAAHAARKEQPDKELVSTQITDRIMSMPQYQNAGCVMWYVDVRDEVRTRHALPQALQSAQKIVVPYCLDGELELFYLESMEELELGMYKILEPKTLLRDITAKQVQIEELDFVMVPGVGFDRNGGRTGHGKGYYDKLLENARPDTPLVALGFECQLFDEIPMQSHDIYMDAIVTETAIYKGRGR